MESDKVTKCTELVLLEDACVLLFHFELELFLSKAEHHDASYVDTKKQDETSSHF